MDLDNTLKRKHASEIIAQSDTHKRKNQTAERLEISLKQALPIIFSTFELGEILICRQVSKDWRLIADKTIEKSLIEEPYDNDVFLKRLERSPRDVLPIPKFRRIKYAYIFKEAAVLQKLNDAMANHIHYGLSPFIGGATLTLECFLSSTSTMHPVTKQFLEHFGVHIIHLKISQKGWDFEVNIPLFVEAVKMCLQNVPNLRTLEINGTGLGCRSPMCHSNDHRSNNALIERDVFKNEVLRRTIYLLKLESLRLCLDDQLCAFKYLEELFSTVLIMPMYIGQLKKLAFNWNRDFELPSQMWNLKELRITIFERELENNLPEKWIDGAPVQKLFLDLRRREPFSEMDVLRKIIDPFSSLKYLKLREIPKVNFRKSFPLTSNEIHTPEFTHVTRLDGIQYKFLAAFKHLRCFVMREDNSHSYWDQRVVLKHVQKMVSARELIISNVVANQTFYDSSIWKLLPKLDLVTFQYQDHRRPRAVMRCHDSPSVPCECRKGSKDECKFMNITGTRAGYDRWHK